MSDVIIRELNKGYGDKPVLRSLSAVFPEGRMTLIKGPSGCGKTTLLRLIAGLETPESGSVAGVPGKIAFLFQENRLFEPFSAVSNVLAVAGGQSFRQEAEQCLAALGLEEELYRSVSDFSGGMKRRAALAGVLCMPSDLVLLDEPFAGLDPEARARAAREIVKRTAGKTVLCVTHGAAAEIWPEAPVYDFMTETGGCR